MLIPARRTLLVWICLLSSGGTFLAAGCSDRFATCKDTRTCAPAEAAGGAAGGNADAGGRAADGGSGANESEGGRSNSGVAGSDEAPPSDGGSNPLGGAASEELRPPEGAFAWYKATEEDVELVHASLADANDFIKSPWIKSLVTVTALQRDMDGGTTATAVYSSGPASGEHSLKHVVSSVPDGLKTYRIRARMGEARYMWIGAPSLSTQQSLAPLVFFDLLDGTVQPTGTTKDPKITALKDLWYECEVTLVGGSEFWLGFSRAPGTKTDVWPTGTKALAWLQGAEVEQTVVSKWRDRVSGRNFTGTGWTWRPSAAEFNGLPALEGNSINFYPPAMRAGEAEDWTFLHDGSGATLVVAMRNLSAYRRFHIARTEEEPESQGFRLGGNDEVSAWEFGAGNGKTSLFSVVGGTPSGTKWLAAAYGTDSSPQARLFENGQLVGSANPTSTPASSVSEHTLTLGGADSSQQLISELLVYPRTLDGSEIEELERYFAPRLGE